MNSTEFLEESRYKKIGIRSITPVKSEKTYDFEVKDDHSFLIDNNIVSSNSLEYAPSISMRITKGKLKPTDLDELAYLYNDNIPKHLNALGIVSRIELYKSRFTRPFRKVQLMIPYDFGLPEYAGLFDYLKDNDLIHSPNRKGYYNYREIPFNKDFTRKDFIKGGWADEIMKNILKNEKDGKQYDFIMGDEPGSAKEEKSAYESVEEDTSGSKK